MDPIVNTTKPAPESLPGFWEPKSQPLFDSTTRTYKVPGFRLSDAQIIENVLSKHECQELIRFMDGSPNFEEVGVQGMKDSKDTRIGSLRTSIWNTELAEIIYNRIKCHVDGINVGKHKATDWWQSRTGADYLHTKWEPCAVSPLLRFMRYGHDGQHYAHYDAGFIYPDETYRSLKSIVIYLTTNEGAATRFVRDGQDDVDIRERKHDDWSRPVNDEEVISKSECITGNVLLFNHRICHDVEHYLGHDQRVIVRGDLIYKLKNK